MSDRWSWVAIDLSAIQHNTREVRRLIKRSCQLMAVVKADAYGHGAVACAQAALEAGADQLGVATVQEALELRAAGIHSPILVLSEPPVTTIAYLLDNGIMPTLHTAVFARHYSNAAESRGVIAPYHLAVNTGMNRIGVSYKDAATFVEQFACHASLQLKGVFTHFATADAADMAGVTIQKRRFDLVLAAMHAKGINPGIVHAANSAALMRYPATHYDMVRLGISLYGFHPCSQTQRLIDLRPALSVHARITDARTIARNEGVGYGFSYRSDAPRHIYTIPVGYADGLPRRLSNRMHFILQEKPVPQVGAICMDQCMFACETPTQPEIGDEVIVVGKHNGQVNTIEAMGKTLNAIPHELTIGFSLRMPLLYR